MNFLDQKMYDRVSIHSNVIINLCGPRRRVKDRKLFEEVNIEIPRRIARSARTNPDILRMIHVSAVGASPDSPSLDLQTKYYGEQAVLEEFPNATIIRPTTMVGLNDYYMVHFRKIIKTWYKKFWVYNDCQQLRQPIAYNDVAHCILNALKLDESVGQIYEVGGPHVYTRLQLYEMMMNTLNTDSSIIKINNELAEFVAQRIINWRYFSHDDIIRDHLDIVVDPAAKKIEDLYVAPVGFPSLCEDILGDYRTMDFPTHDTYRA